MINGDNLKKILWGISLILLLIGQFLLLLAGKMLLGTVFSVFSLAIFGLTLRNMHLQAVAFFLKMFQGINASIVSLKSIKSRPIKSRPVKIRTDVTKKAVFPYTEDGNKAEPARKTMLDLTKPVNFSINVNKILLYIFAVVIFALVQVFFFTGKVTMGLMLLLADMALFIATINNKKTVFIFDFAFSSVMKILTMAAAVVLLVVGWIFLINSSLTMQYWGVALTFTGCILGFLLLPASIQSNNGNEANAIIEKSDILFLKPDFINNFVFKAVAIVAIFVLLKIGYFVMMNPETNLYSMVFYAAAGLILFFILPITNFPEQKTENKALDIARLVMMGFALFIAYLGQVDITKNLTNQGVLKYLAAALIFIFAFPVYLNREYEDEAKVPLRVEAVFLIVITAIGIFLRLWQLDTRPFGVENDEAGGLTGHIMPVLKKQMNFTVGNYGIYFHIVELFMKFINDPRIDLKMMAVCLGIIAIPAMYFFIRAYFNPKTAMFATSVFVILRWNLFHSRFGQGNYFTLLAEIMSLYFICTAIKKNDKTIWLLAGFTLGMTWHGVMTGFLIIIPMVLYFIIKSFSSENYLKRHAVSIVAFALGFWMFGSMIIHNYFISDKIYFSRIGEVSVFSKDPNAPSKNVGKGIVDNARAVLLMFNQMGDSRQRNSGGVPLEPTIDFLSSMLFAIGFLYAIYYSKYYMYFIMVMVFFSQAAGSIFSIEAPSAMRAIGTMIPVMFFISLTFDKITYAFRRVFSRKLEIIFVPLLILLFLIPIAKENYRQYFQRWISGLDELSTAAGMYAHKLGTNTRIVLYTGLYYPGHPPFRIYRWDDKVNSAGRFTTVFVWLRMVETENFSIFFHYDTWQNIESIKSTFFPEAEIVQIDQKYFNKDLENDGLGMFVKSLNVKNEIIKKYRGLYGTYSFGTGEVKNDLPVFRKENEVKIPYNVSWRGLLMVPYYGRYRIYNTGRAQFSLNIDGHNVRPNNPVILAEGLHDIRINASCRNTTDRLDLNMECGRMTGRILSSQEQVRLDEKYFYNWKNHGLHTYYYNGYEWDANPVQFEINNIDTDINCYQGADSYVFKGYITAPMDGNYIINNTAGGFTRIVIDGKYYWERLGGRDTDARAVQLLNSKFPGSEKVTRFNLKKGRHVIEIYAQGSVIMKWATPDNPAMTVIPVNVYEPDNFISDK